MARQFVFSWRVTLFACLCFIVFVNLGLWQLRRADEKTALLEERAVQEKAPPVSAAELAGRPDIDNLKVALRGEYGDPVWLLDNRVLDGVIGFEVLQVFSDEEARDFVVNRGFVPGGRTRADLPVIPPVPGIVSIEGRLKQFKPGVVIGAAPVEDWNGKPVIVQQADVSELKGSLGRELYPSLVMLAEDQPGSLPRFWPDTVMLPVQHRGYALQWFAMALAVVIVWGFFTWRKTNDGTDA